MERKDKARTENALVRKIKISPTPSGEDASIEVGGVRYTAVSHGILGSDEGNYRRIFKKATQSYIEGLLKSYPNHSVVVEETYDSVEGKTRIVFDIKSPN